MPGFVDAHTHPVFAGDRASEFAARMAGEAYSAGGIRSTVAATRAATDAELETTARRLADEALRQGTTTLEAKSGYGLTVADEERSLRAARAVAATTTFLGAHVVPEGMRPRRLRRRSSAAPMLDACAPLADWIDVFCEEGAFDVDETRAILRGRPRQRARPPRAHQPAGPVAGCPAGGRAGRRQRRPLHPRRRRRHRGAGRTPGSSPRWSRRPSSARAAATRPARRLLDAGVTVALATDCNPGTSYTTSMPFVIALAVREQHLTVEQALRAATLGGAASLRRDDVGHLRPGARADLVVLDAPDPAYLAYRPGVPLVHTVVRGGSIVTAPSRG